MSLLTEKFPKFYVVILLLVWTFTISYGVRALQNYSATAGTVGKVSEQWPASSQLPHASEQPATAVLFLHPECPCSKASVDELDSFIARTGARARVLAVFVKPPGWDGEEVRGELWEKVARIPGAQAFIDEGGQEAHRFGAETSGHFFLFGPSGKLWFQGGITPARGHRGENRGLSAAVDWVNRGQGEVTQTEPFGCPLFSTHAGT